MRAAKPIVKVFGMVTAIPDFKDRPKVINGRSDLLAAVFGERGRDVRSAAGMSSMPFDTAVAIEMVVEIDDGR